jgi:hypothetical protein
MPAWRGGGRLAVSRTEWIVSSFISRLNAALDGRYRIERELGAG